MNLTPYLRFNNDRCREAMNFYKSAFGGGDIELMTIGESPMAKEMPPESANKIMHATFTKGDIRFHGADMMKDKAVIGDNVSIAVNCDSEEELNDLFNNLADGGDVFMKPEKVPWGAIYAMVTDKYGVEWQLNYQIESVK